MGASPTWGVVRCSAAWHWRSGRSCWSGSSCCLRPWGAAGRPAAAEPAAGARGGGPAGRPSATAPPSFAPLLRRPAPLVGLGLSWLWSWAPPHPSLWTCRASSGSAAPPDPHPQLVQEQPQHSDSPAAAAGSAPDPRTVLLSELWACPVWSSAPWCRVLLPCCWRPLRGEHSDWTARPQTPSLWTGTALRLPMNPNTPHETLAPSPLQQVGVILCLIVFGVAGLLTNPSWGIVSAMTCPHVSRLLCFPSHMSFHFQFFC